MNIKSLVLGVALAASWASSAKANLVMNGHLERNDTTPTITFFTNVPTTSYIPNWTIQGASPNATYNAEYIYDSVVSTGLAGQPAAPGSMPSDYRLCSTAGGFQSGFTATCANPDGPGHFINLDGDPGFPAAISQPIIGLVSGTQYRLTFSWAAVERVDATGPTSNEYLTVTLGNPVNFSTPDIFPGPYTTTCSLPDCLPAHGFSGWLTTNYDFTWDGSANNVLTFLAHGHPGGLPPTVNLDGISITQIPEPSTWALLLAAGFGVLGVDARRRRRPAGC